jgi:hypothetical protein
MRVLLLFVLLVQAGLSGPPPKARAAVAAPSDAAIEQNIRARFAKSKIAEDRFTVRVQGGKAIIEGTTNVVQREGVATRLAKLGGAVAVDNRIHISDEAREKAAEKLAEHRKRPGAHPAPTKPTAAPVKPTSTRAEPISKNLAPSPAVAAPIPRAQVKH